MSSFKEVVVVGCGVAGLTCALRLKEHFPVKIVAKDLPPATTSNLAAAFWYPYRAYPQELVVRWSRISLEQYYLESQSAESGVSIKRLVEVFDHPPESPWWKDVVREFREATAAELPAASRYGYVMSVPMIESGTYIDHLVRRFRELGGEIEQLEIGSFSELESDRRLIVNCTGLGARDLCGDSSMYPIRGQIIRIEAPWLSQFLLDESGPTYIVPRNNDCILGGTAQDNDWRLEADQETASQILERCRALVPQLSTARIIEHKVGLRPGRTRVRLELETLSDTCSVIHNYGHGGAGFTLCWGCAADVLDMALRVN